MKCVEIVKQLLDAGWKGVPVMNGSNLFIAVGIGNDENYPLIGMDGEEYADTDFMGRDYKVYDLEHDKEIVGVIEGKKVLRG